VRREEEKKLAYPSRGPHLRAMASASKTLFLALLWLSSGQLSFKILYLNFIKLFGNIIPVHWKSFNGSDKSSIGNCIIPESLKSSTGSPPGCWVELSSELFHPMTRRLIEVSLVGFLSKRCHSMSVT
jgi:hypothetical protein